MRLDGWPTLARGADPAYGEDMDKAHNGQDKDPYAPENIDTGEPTPEQLRKWRDEGGFEKSSAPLPEDEPDSTAT